MDNEIVQSPEGKVTTLLNSTPFTGLSIVQVESNSTFAFTVAEQRFKGRSYLLRLDANKWIAPLSLSLAAADLKQHIVFNTLKFAAKESGEALPVDPNEGFEELDDRKFEDYFGIERRTVTYPPSKSGPVSTTIAPSGVLSEMLEGYAQESDYVRWVDNKRLYNVAKVRELLTKMRIDTASKKSHGFEEVSQGTFGIPSKLIDELACLAFDLQRRDNPDQKLMDGGYLRTSGRRRFYHVEKTRQLIAEAETKLKADGFVPTTDERRIEIFGTSDANEQRRIISTAFGVNDVYSINQTLEKHGYIWGGKVLPRGENATVGSGWQSGPVG